MPAPARRRPRRARLSLLVVAALLLGACSGGDDDAGAGDGDPAVSTAADRVEVSAADLGPFAEVDPEDLAGPGTPLGGGLEVPEGALLQGTAFPDLVGGGYRALLLVTGEPVDVYDAMAAQAAGLGMLSVGAPGCLAAELIVGCQGTFVDGADGESLALTVNRKVDLFTGVASGLGLLYRPPGSVEDGPDGTSATPPTTALTSVALPDPVAPPPIDDVALAVRPPGSPKRTIEPGSTLVGLPGPCACEGGGWSMVVRLDGVERDILHGYMRQFVDVGEPRDLEDRHQADITLVGVRVGSGTKTAEIRAHLPDDGEAYAIITVRGA